MASTNGNGFVAVAKGKIFSGKGSIHIDTSSATGDGGNLFCRRGVKRQGAAIKVITGRSGFGGDVDLGNLKSVTIDTRSFAPGHSGDQLRL